MDLQINPKDLVGMCRICLQNDSFGTELMIRMFDTTIQYLNISLSDLFESFTAVQLDPGDVFPRHICTKCRDALVSGYEFQLKCIKSDHDIRMVLGYPPKKSAIEQKLQIKSETIYLEDNNSCHKIIKCEERATYSSDDAPEMNDELATTNEEPSNTLEDLSHQNEDVPLNKKYRKLKKKTLNVCNLCNKSFATPFRLLRHAVVHETEGRPFECELCKRRFRLNNQLIRHKSVDHSIDMNAIVKTNFDDADSDWHWNEEESPLGQQLPTKDKRKLDNQIYHCQVCKKQLNGRSNYLRHAKIHPESKPYECDVCKEGFATENLLILHKMTHFGDLNKTDEFKIYQCAECPRAFQKQTSLTSHMKVHKDRHETVAGKTCEYCKRTFSSLSHLSRHMKTHDKSKLYICKFCNKTFNDREEFMEHMDTHKGAAAEKFHVCYICNKNWQTAFTLKVHMRTHTGESPYLCNECGKSFTNRSNLRNHMFTHIEVKEFECAQCTQRFKSKRSLKSHLLTHFGIKAFKCDTCDAAFYKDSSLISHKQRVHSGPRCCKICDTRFDSFELLLQHMNEEHPGDTPYKCEFCDRSYKLNSLLVRHMQKHVGSNTYRCKECPAAFRLKIQLKRHKYQHHFVPIEESYHQLQAQ